MWFIKAYHQDYNVDTFIGPFNSRRGASKWADKHLAFKFFTWKICRMTSPLEMKNKLKPHPDPEEVAD